MLKVNISDVSSLAKSYLLSLHANETKYLNYKELEKFYLRLHRESILKRYFLMNNYAESKTQTSPYCSEIFATPVQNALLG